MKSLHSSCASCRNRGGDGLIRAPVQLGTAIIDVEVREPEFCNGKMRRLSAARRTSDNDHPWSICHRLLANLQLFYTSSIPLLYLFYTSVDESGFISSGSGTSSLPFSSILPLSRRRARCSLTLRAPRATAPADQASSRVGLVRMTAPAALNKDAVVRKTVLTRRRRCIAAMCAISSRSTTSRSARPRSLPLTRSVPGALASTKTAPSRRTITASGGGPADSGEATWNSHRPWVASPTSPAPTIASVNAGQHDERASLSSIN